MKKLLAITATPVRSAGFFAFVVPAAALILFVLAYAHAFPIWETWYFTDVWLDFATGGHWFKDLFINRWEHIVALPNFINLVFDNLFNYDQRAEIYAITAITIGSLYVLLTCYAPEQAPLSRIVLGLTFLSVRAAEIWLDAWNTAMAVPLFIVVVTGACMAGGRSLPRVLAAGVLAFIGINSGGYCLPILPAILVLLVVQCWQSGSLRSRGHLLRLGTWLACLVILIAYWAYMRGSNSASIIHTLLNPAFYHLLVRQFSFALSENNRLGLAMFVIALLCAAITVVMQWHKLRQFSALPGLAFLTTYAFVLAILVGAARTHEGHSLPVHARYIPFMCVLPLSLLIFSESLWNNARSEGTRHARTALVMRIVLLCFIGAIIYSNVSFFRAFRQNEPQLNALQRAYEQSPYTLTPGMFLYRSASDAKLVEQGLATMRRLGAGPFNPNASTRDLALLHSMADTSRNAPDDIDVSVDLFEKRPDGNTVISGWSYDKKLATQPRIVIAKASTNCEETALTGLNRDDVAQFFKAPAAAASGWLITFPARCMVQSIRNVTIYAITSDGRWVTQTAAGHN
jgi:hypothetical protein